MPIKTARPQVLRQMANEKRETWRGVRPWGSGKRGQETEMERKEKDAYRETETLNF